MTIKHSNSLNHNIFKILLLSFAGSIIYGLPYFRSYYYDAYKQMYHLSNLEMGTLGSAYGLLGLFSYILGGILADKFKAKYLLIFSMIATGLGGILHLVLTDFRALVIIYGLWGITSLLTFWPALMKMVRMQAKDNEQSRAYGIFEGGRGIFTAAHLTIATFIFSILEYKFVFYLGNIDYIIIFYSISPIIVGILFIFILKNDEIDEEEKEKINIKRIWQIIKMPAIWIIIVMVFCMYFYQMSIYYFTPYATNVIGVSATLAASIAVFKQYLRPFASTSGGFLADKFGKGQVMAAGFILMALGTVVLILAGEMKSYQVVVLVLAGAIIYFGLYTTYGIYFSFLSEGGIPIGVTGLAIGLVSTIGYIPEIIAPLIAGEILDRFNGNKGYYIYFILMIAMAFIGFIFSIIWCKTYAKYHEEAQNASKKVK